MGKCDLILKRGDTVTLWDPNNFTVEALVERIINKQITVPEYQRGQVWEPAKEKKLIDSIKRGFPFGAILLFCDEDGKFHLIDGLQRCTALYRYSTNPAQFFNDDTDIDDHLINLIFDLTGFSSNIENTKKAIKQLIGGWIRDNNKNLSDIKRINHTLIEECIKDRFPSIRGNIKDEEKLKLNNSLHNFILEYSDKCTKISKTKIPTIIYNGNKEFLPEVFSRINSNGTTLSKYQILASTWNYEKIKVTDPIFDPVLDYVKKFYMSIENSGFTLTNDYNQMMSTREINLYQLLFGFGKMIKAKYPLLFGSSKDNGDYVKTESLAFNLVNACLGNKNSRLFDLPIILRDCNLRDDDLNKFMKNILQCIDDVDKIFKPYLGFKLNSRKSKSVIVPPEMQIVSVISNLFNIKYLDIVVDEPIILNRTVSLVMFKNRKDLVQKFKNNVFKNFIIDVLNGKWRGTGDKSLDDVSIDNLYYTREHPKSYFEKTLDSWFLSNNENKKEYSTIASPNDAEKLLLSVIYVNKFTAAAHLDQSKYDIEHLCTKKILKDKIKRYGEKNRLPISSFGNICLLPEWDNRTKKDSVLYDDKKYLNALGEKIAVIEKDFSFTKREDFDYLNIEGLDFDDFKKSYQTFITNRFELQKKLIIEKLLGQ